MTNRRQWQVALGTVVFVDVLRVFLPSLITLFGQAGGTPPEHMGLFALLWFALPLTVPLLAQAIPPRMIATAAGVGLIATRIVLQFSSGGDLQLYTASVGATLGLAWLTATAIRTPDTACMMRGFLSGLGIATIIHAVLADIDAMWRGPLVAVPVLVVELVAFGYLLVRGGPDAEVTRSPAPLLACGPILLLWGMYLGNPAHTYRVTGLLGTAMLAAVTVVWLYLLRGPVMARAHRAVSGVVLTAATVYFVVDGLDTAGPALLLVVTVCALVSVAVLLRESAPVEPSPRSTGRGFAVSASMLGFLVLMFAYYAAFDLGYPNWWVPPLAAVLVAVIGFAGADIAASIRKPRFSVTVTAGAAGALALTLIAPLWQQSSPAVDAPSDGLRVAAYNIRMGFDLSGRLALDQQADALAALNPHVIALSEVDRGWLLNGGHDNLRRLADRLDMDLVWAPADGNHWGDALLTNLRVGDVKHHRLIAGGPTGAQALEATVHWEGERVTVIATHLQPPPEWEPLDQVEQLAQIASDAAADGPVILAGDLNLEPGTPAWDTLTAAGLSDPFSRPFPTIPGDTGQQIDHILLTDEFTARDPANPDLPHSDHRPIAVTVTLEP